MLIATKDFTAHIDGVNYSLHKGETFAGTRHAVVLLSNQGLLEKKQPRKDKKDAC